MAVGLWIIAVLLTGSISWCSLWFW